MPGRDSNNLLTGGLSLLSTAGEMMNQGVKNQLEFGRKALGVASDIVLGGQSIDEIKRTAQQDAMLQGAMQAAPPPIAAASLLLVRGIGTAKRAGRVLNRFKTYLTDTEIGMLDELGVRLKDEMGDWSDDMIDHYVLKVKPHLERIVRRAGLLKRVPSRNMTKEQREVRRASIQSIARNVEQITIRTAHMQDDPNLILEPPLSTTVGLANEKMIKKKIRQFDARRLNPKYSGSQNWRRSFTLRDEDILERDPSVLSDPKHRAKFERFDNMFVEGNQDETGTAMGVVLDETDDALTDQLLDPDKYVAPSRLRTVHETVPGRGTNPDVTMVRNRAQHIAAKGKISERDYQRILVPTNEDDVKFITHLKENGFDLSPEALQRLNQDDLYLNAKSFLPDSQLRKQYMRRAGKKLAKKRAQDEARHATREKAANVPGGLARDPEGLKRTEELAASDNPQQAAGSLIAKLFDARRASRDLSSGKVRVLPRDVTFKDILSDPGNEGLEWGVQHQGRFYTIEEMKQIGQLSRGQGPLADRARKMGKMSAGAIGAGAAMQGAEEEAAKISDEQLFDFIARMETGKPLSDPRSWNTYGTPKGVPSFGFMQLDQGAGAVSDFLKNVPEEEWSKFMDPDRYEMFSSVKWGENSPGATAAMTDKERQGFLDYLGTPQGFEQQKAHALKEYINPVRKTHTDAGLNATPAMIAVGADQAIHRGFGGWRDQIFKQGKHSAKGYMDAELSGINPNSDGGKIITERNGRRGRRLQATGLVPPPAPKAPDEEQVPGF